MAHGPIQYASRYGRCAFRRSLFGGMLVSVRNHKLVCLILISILCILGCASLSQAIQREARRVRLVHMRLPVIIGRPKACCGQVHPEVGLCLPSLVDKRSFHATLKYVLICRYNNGVHAAWASAGLAPEQICCQQLPGGWYMVIMEELDEGWVTLEKVLGQQAQARAREAALRAYQWRTNWRSQAWQMALCMVMPETPTS